MAEDKKLVEAITSMKEDFAQWYTDVCKKAELMSYSSVKGCMIFKPAGYAIWENIKNEMDRRFKETGVENVYLPMFIPESLPAIRTLLNEGKVLSPSPILQLNTTGYIPLVNLCMTVSHLYRNHRKVSLM